ncbi:zinc finger protein 862-like [Saccostrea cucullata]
MIELKFRNIHAIIKHNRSISDFDWMNSLDEAKGMQHGSTYNNRWAATAFIECISDTLKEEMLSQIKGTKFFSLTMDGTTDSGTAEQETLFIRFCSAGKISCHFLCIGEPRSTTSADLLKFVKDKLDENKLSDQMKKLVGFGCDGASNMMGKRNGLVALLQKDFTEIIGVHCLAHRLELAYKDAVKNDPLYNRLTTLLLRLYYFYKNSSKQRKNLKECMKVLNLIGTLPHRVNSTRWLPHMRRALDTLFTSYPAFSHHLQDASHTNAKANGLARLLESSSIMTYAGLLLRSCSTVEKIIEKISERYQDLSGELLDATTIGSLKNWPIENQEKFGSDHVKTLVNRFSNTLENAQINVSEIMEEWQMLRCLVYRRFGGQFMVTSWQDIHAAFGESGVPNILALIDLIHSLAPTSVINETGFNQLKLIKTDRRHRLTERHLNDLMVIRLQSPSIVNFDPNPAIDKWMVSPSRQRSRGTYKRGKKRPQSEERCEVAEVTVEIELLRESEGENEVESEPEIVETERQGVEREEVDRESDEDSEEDLEQNLDTNDNMLREIIEEIEMETE